LKAVLFVGGDEKIMSYVDKGSIALADRAEQIAKEKRISFCDALPMARREFATVEQNTGSPLRDQQQSSFPDAAKVRAAVVQGLMDVPIWSNKNGGGLNLYSIAQATDAAGKHLAALGLGPQIISTLNMELTDWLNNNGNDGLPSSVISKAGDHMQQVYADALKNKIATQAWSEKKGLVMVQSGVQVNLCDGLSVNGGNAVFDLESAHLAERATEISKQLHISFGEALTMARHGFADDVIDAADMAQKLTGTLKNVFNTIFGGKPQKVVGEIDLLKVKEEVSKTLRGLNIGGPLGKVTEAITTSLNSATGVMSSGDVDSVVAKAVSAAQKAYAQALSQS
jgi:hypothetical protein